MTSVWNSAHPWLRELVSYEPGKPIEDVARELGLQPRRHHQARLERKPARPFAEGARRHAARRWSASHFYPDGGGYYLREAIAEKFGLEHGERHPRLRVERDHRIHRQGLPESRRRDHRRAPRLRRLQAHGHALRREHHRGARPELRARPRRAWLAAITPRTKEIFIANPNNPTGTLLLAGGDRPLHGSACPSTSSSSSTRPTTSSCANPPDTLKYVREGRNVVVLRTFSKIQGLANLRIGYGLAQAGAHRRAAKDPPALQRQRHRPGRRARRPRSTTSTSARPATSPSRAASGCKREFAALGLEFVPSHANFVLVQVGDGKAVFQALMKEGSSSAT